MTEENREYKFYILQNQLKMGLGLQNHKIKNPEHFTVLQPYFFALQLLHCEASWVFLIYVFEAFVSF